MKMVWPKDYYSSFSLCMQEYRMYKYSSIRVCLAYVAWQPGGRGAGGYFLIRG